jgi:hypothetical protein
MALAVSSSSSQTATINTEHDLATPTTSGVYVLSVDLSAMQAGDIVELRFKKKVRTGDTIRTAYQTTFADAPTAETMIAVSVPVPCPFGCTVTLKQVAGTGRAYPWSLETL